ncbi:hypothetical protein A4X13_0g6235 [Tilletia indica]|uniref:Uncharacterized protein n=1 Tax=Tilletia indica TaxID=43049 RepID=A0A177TF85_9BASI|nr:hypothetical protein A4X13_0g6235 [Tilletia indica]
MLVASNIAPIPDHKNTTFVILLDTTQMARMNRTKGPGYPLIAKEGPKRRQQIVPTKAGRRRNLVKVGRW